MPVYCEVVGVIGSAIVLTYWNLDVVALDRADIPFDDRLWGPWSSPQERLRVTFAGDLIGQALDAGGGAS